MPNCIMLYFPCMVLYFINILVNTFFLHCRYCFVQLTAKTNAEKAMKDLEQIKFGSGKLKVEKKFSKDEEDLSAEAIDPYTYVF